MTVSCRGEKIKVRLYCIDAPELGQVPWGEQARDHLHSLTGNSVGIKAIDKDKYGRLVARVLVNDVDLNLRMVADGFAAVFPRYCHDEQYYSAERNARAGRIGVWAMPGVHERPWEWRRQ